MEEAKTILKYLQELNETYRSQVSPLSLSSYLETTHSLQLGIDIITDESLTTQGDAATNPTGRFCPRRIIPWDTFSTEQEKIWSYLASHPSFFTEPSFPTRHQLEFVKSFLRPVSSENNLRDNERNAVLDAVWIIQNVTYANASLRRHIGLNGTVVFEADTDGICQTADGRRYPALCIKYKVPQALTLSQVVKGFVGEIQPDHDVVNKQGQSFEFEARRLATAAVTELFSQMVCKGTRYGYICTGEAYVFLYIPSDPSCVYYSVCIPSLDFDGDDENRFYRTAVAQVYAFVLQAVRSPLPSQAWHDAAEGLYTWVAKYEDVLRSIPEAIRKEEHTTAYRAQRWESFTGSPIGTHSGCHAIDDKRVRSSDDTDDKDNGKPSTAPNTRDLHMGESENTSSSEASLPERAAGNEANTGKRQNIQDRPYCTHECLRGVASGGPLDDKCPNIADHGEAHIDEQEFIALLRHQLATDRGHDADCIPLGIFGATSSLFKLCLTLHGYTLVAKGVEENDARHLQHENEVYDHVRSLQGTSVPVCLGTIDLIKPYYFDRGVYTKFLLLSYGGRPVLCEMSEVEPSVVDQIITALSQLHECNVLHHDAETRNVLYDQSSGRCMLIDLMLAETPTQKPPRSTNRWKWAKLGRHRSDAFSAELQSLRERLTRLPGSYM